uniref:Uncharacterized protein n=2 Tax=Avena sativa TaxID=4498 RepID=A0ACD5UF52_AVESA
MEIGVAALGVLASKVAIAVASAAVNSAVSKLRRVSRGDHKNDANFLITELRLIEHTIGKFGGPSQSVWLAPLRNLAYAIEDCLACFEVKKTSAQEFAKQIAQLKVRSIETGEQILRHMSINERMEGLAVGFRGQNQGQPAAASAAALEVSVPQELRELLGTQSEGNLNCLLYFCMFPHDHHASRNPLIRRWLAEGLVQGEGAAVQYLKTLIEAKIINTIAKCNNGRIKRCQPPLDILKSISEQSSSENFMHFCDDMAKLQVECVRRLSLHPNEAASGDLILTDFSHLHTLAIFHGGANPEFYEAILNFAMYEVLRVLDLKECAPLCQRHLSAICNNLLLLKYLSFQFERDNDRVDDPVVDRVPRDISKLVWLETLDVRGSKIVTVHKELLMLPKLKHLLGKFQLSQKDKNLFGGMSTDLQKFLKQKSVLERLSGFVTGNRLGFPQLMSLMRRLRKVKIWCESDASEANLADISSAITKFIRDGSQEQGRSLSIDFQECSGQFLNTIQVEGSLASLKLCGNLSQFPQFVAQLRGIEELCLSFTALSWSETLTGLSNLSILKYLKLAENNLGPLVIEPQHFKRLERICLVGVESLKVTILAEALPRIVSIHMICKALDILPGTPGIEIAHIVGLEEVELHPEVDQGVMKHWEAAAEAHPNEPRVFVVESQARSSANP